MATYNYQEIISVNPAVTKRFHDAISSSSSLLKILFGRAQGGNTMWPTQTEHSFTGSQYMGLPVQLTLGAGDSVSRVNQYQAISYTEGSYDDQFDFARYNFTTARAGFQLATRERSLMQKGDAKRLDAFELQSNQAANKIVALLTTDLNSNTADSDGKLIGFEFAIDSGNTVGNINQASVAAWQSTETAINTTLTTAHLVQALAAATRDSMMYGWEAPDVLMLAERTSSKLYSFLLNAISSNSFVPVDRDFVKYGFAGAAFHGALILPNTAISSGVVLAINTSTWALASADDTFAPIPEEPTRVPKTNATDYVWSWSGSVGVGDPARNSKLTGCQG